MEILGSCRLDLAAYYLQKLHNCAHTDRKMRVLFLVHEPSLWDKQEYVYDLFAADDMVETTLVLLSSYNAIDAAEHKPAGRYVDKTWHFFHDRYPNVFDFTNVIDLNVFHADYIFLPTPYDGLRPLRGTRTSELAKIAKICYIAYGTQGSKFFIQWETELAPFFAHVSFHFCDSEEEQTAMEAAYPDTVAAGVQHFEDIGYPSFEPYLEYRCDPRIRRRVLWMPRWNTEANIGGSHFLVYKDAFLAFARKYGSETLEFAIRPHPFMFDNFIHSGQMTAQEVTDFKAQLAAYGIVLDEGQYSVFEVLTSADILLADFSSLNMPFFLLDRPLIYCPNDNELSDDYKKMTACSYVAETWGAAERYLEQLIRYEDPLAHQRRGIVEEFRAKHIGAAQRIADRIKRDFAESLHPHTACLPEIEQRLFEAKKTLVSLIGRNSDLLPHFCEQKWYPLYLEMLSMHPWSDHFVWGEQQILVKLKELYATAVEREHRACLTLAMLLFADPLILSVPLEIDLFPEGLYADLREAFAEQRKELGIGTVNVYAEECAVHDRG